MIKDAGSVPGEGGGDGTDGTAKGYRYGFNGKENDNEVKGEGNQQDYGFRIYDPRVGKFLSVDPLTKSYPELTPYQFASNRPIDAIDLDGAEASYKDPITGEMTMPSDAIRRPIPPGAYMPSNEAAKAGSGNTTRGAIAAATVVAAVVAAPYVASMGTAGAGLAWRWYLSGGSQILAAAAGDPVAAFGTGATVTATAVGAGVAANELGAREEAASVGVVASMSEEAASVSRVSRVYESRINIANGRTRFTPLRPSSGEPVSAGWDHVLSGHFNQSPAPNRSVFTIEAEEVKSILQSKQVVSSPVTPINGGQYVRTVDVGKEIGTTSLKQGGTPTSWMKIFTDKAGNLISTYPVAAPKSP